MPLLGEFTQIRRCRGFPSQVDVLRHRKSLMEQSVCVFFLKTDSFKFHQAAPEGPRRSQLGPAERRGEELPWHRLRPWPTTKSNRVEPRFI